MTAVLPADIRAQLPGVAAARFFINGLASTTKGLDVVGHYRWRTVATGTFDFTVAGNLNDTRVIKIPTSTSVLNPAPTLFARSRILTLEDGTPATKVTGTADWSLDNFGATARVTYYGNVTQPGTTPTIVVNGVTMTNDIQTGRRAIADLELRYQPKWASSSRSAPATCSTPIPRRRPLISTRPAWSASLIIRRSASTGVTSTSAPACAGKASRYTDGKARPGLRPGFFRDQPGLVAHRFRLRYAGRGRVRGRS